MGKRDRAIPNRGNKTEVWQLKWTYIVAIDPDDLPEITPDTEIKTCWMMVGGERKDIPVVDMYRYPPDWDFGEMRFHKIAVTV